MHHLRLHYLLGLSVIVCLASFEPLILAQTATTPSASSADKLSPPEVQPPSAIQPTQSTQPEPAAPSMAQATPPATKTSALSDDLDFNLLESKPAATQPAEALAIGRVDQQVRKRRSMLTWHQSLGLSMLAAMAITSVLGQLNYRDLYGGGSGSGNFIWPHRIGVGVTTLAFTATGLLGLFAPEPYEKKHHGLDSALVHKISAAAATAGMLAQAVLGFFTARQADAGNQDGLHTKARWHQVLGYTTLGFVSVAALAYVF